MPVFSKQLGVMDYSSPEAVKSIANHLRVMQEELEYRLMFLDSSNISEIDMDNTNIFSSKGGLIEFINETDESIAKLSIRDDEIAMSVTDLETGLRSELSITAEQIRSEVADEVNGLNSTITQTASKIRSEVADEVAGLNSTITQTASQIRSEVSAQVSGLDSDISNLEGTVSDLETTFNSEITTIKADVVNLNSSITQTASQIRSEVSAEISGLDAEIATINGEIGTLQADVVNLNSSITQTAAQIRSEVSAEISGINTDIDGINADIVNLNSSITQTAASIRSEVSTEIDGVKSDISSLEQTASSIEASVQDLETDMGHTLRMDAQGVYIVDAAGNTVTISGGQIDATDLNLSGRITFTDLDSSTQNAINNAGGISEAQATTLITSTLVSSPNIQGATYWDADGKHKMLLSDPGDNYGTFRLYNDYYGSVPYFSIYDNETGVTSLMALGYTFLMVDDGMTTTTVKPYLAWDFSNATVNGLHLTFS